MGILVIGSGRLQQEAYLREVLQVDELPQHAMSTWRLADLPHNQRTRALQKAAANARLFPGFQRYHDSVPCTSAEVCVMCGAIGKIHVRHNLEHVPRRGYDRRCLTSGCGYVKWGQEDAT